MRLKRGQKLFTSDAKAMFSNIDPLIGIQTISLYITEYSHELNSYFPKEAILSLLKLVMENSVFKFGETFWLQVIGTAMGTPCASSYATIFFAYFERKNILPTFYTNLPFYIRFIDDIFGIWDESGTANFHDFNKSLNNQCKLTWKTERPSMTANFLDLTLRIENNKIVTKTYQKPENLFPYIPGNWAHPPGLLNSFVTSLVRTYWIQNNYSKDFRSST